MRKAVLLLASMAVALLLASAMVLVIPKQQAQAAFPGINGKIAFLSDRDGGNNEIYTISFSRGKWGNAQRLTFYPRKSDKTPSFSPDGKKIVWEQGDSLFKMNADGSGQQKIPNTVHSNHEVGRYGSYGGNPAYSPDGRRIIFDKDKDIWTIRPGGLGLTRITNAPVDATCEAKPTFAHPVWSPVGNKIAFS